MFNFLKRKPKHKFDFSKYDLIWRELYSPPLLKILSEKLNISGIKEMYSLVFFPALRKNLQDAISYIDNKDYLKLAKMLSRVPDDVGERTYPWYDLVYIVTITGAYFAIVLDRENKKNISLTYFMPTAGIDMEIFEGKRLIYPI